MAKPLHTDARKRPFTQVRLYGELADLVEERAQAEGKARSFLVDELLRLAWHLDTEPSPLMPGQTFTRQPTRSSEPYSEPPPPPPPRARVFLPTPRRPL